MAGQVKHAKIFSGIIPDLTLLSVLTRLRARNTDALISAVADVLRGEGIELLDSTAFLAPLLAQRGHAGAPRAVARGAGGLRLRLSDGRRHRRARHRPDDRRQGQGGRRGRGDGRDRRGDPRGRAKSPGPGTRIVKVAKPKQDMRFDVPVVGVATIEVMRQPARPRSRSTRAGRWWWTATRSSRGGCRGHRRGRPAAGGDDR